jgi:hypothetical protein
MDRAWTADVLGTIEGLGCVDGGRLAGTVREGAEAEICGRLEPDADAPVSERRFRNTLRSGGSESTHSCHQVI